MRPTGQNSIVTPAARTPIRRCVALHFAALLLVMAMPFSAHAGYTHYFTWQAAPQEEPLKACIADIQKIISARREVLAGVDGEGQLVVTADQVEFNGIAADAHEPFAFPGTPGFSFCKTNQKPYDEVVVACLYAARDHFSPHTLLIRSDGDTEDLAEGRQLYATVLGRQPKRLLDNDDTPLGGEPPIRLRPWLAFASSALVFFVVVWFFMRKCSR